MLKIIASYKRGGRGRYQTDCVDDIIALAKHPVCEVAVYNSDGQKIGSSFDCAIRALGGVQQTEDDIAKQSVLEYLAWCETHHAARVQAVRDAGDDMCDVLWKSMDYWKRAENKIIMVEIRRGFFNTLVKKHEKNRE